MSAVDSEMTLRDYASIVDRRKWIVVAAVLITTLVALALSVLQTPIYVADSEVLIEPRGEDALFDDQIENVDYRAIETEIQVIEGQAVRARVQENLGLDSPPSSVDASSIGDTDVISVAVRDANATNAAILATAYAEAYVEIRREQSVNDLLSASTEVQTAINELQADIDALDDDDPQRPVLVAQLANFTTTLDQLRVDARLRTGGATVIKVADVPASPVEPTPARTVMLAAVVGLLLGLGAAFLADYLDDKIRTAEDVEALTGRTVLAQVPVDPPIDVRPLAISDPSHLSVEAYRGLRTNIQFLALDERLSVIQITSSLSGEGKTTTATNLAVVLARAGNSVALVDADLRRSRVHETFQIRSVPGLTEMLLGVAPKDVVQVVDVDANHRISVYASGAIPANPSEMLSGRRMKMLLQRMGEHYDYVIVDSAPVLPVSDSLAVAGSADGVIVVGQAGRITGSNLTETLERLDRVSAPIIGVVLNQARGANADAYVYGGYRPLVAAETTALDRADGDDSSETLFSDA